MLLWLGFSRSETFLCRIYFGDFFSKVRPFFSKADSVLQNLIITRSQKINTTIQLPKQKTKFPIISIFITVRTPTLDSSIQQVVKDRLKWLLVLIVLQYRHQSGLIMLKKRRQIFECLLNIKNVLVFSHIRNSLKRGDICLNLDQYFQEK